MSFIVWFQMKKHMQDLANKISRQGLEHNELWEARITIITSVKVKWTEMIPSTTTHNISYVPPFPFNYCKKKSVFSTFLVLLVADLFRNAQMNELWVVCT